MADVFICDFIRTPIGRHGGALARVRADDLAAVPIRSLIERNRSMNLVEIDKVLLGCANRPARTTETWPAWLPCSRAYPRKFPA